MHIAAIVLPLPFILSLLLIDTSSHAAAPPDSCVVAAEQGSMQFPVDKLKPSHRCLISKVIKGHMTSGLTGPIRTPIPHQLYLYLLDHPPLIASLLERLALATYQFRQEGSNRFWFNDGEGTQGILTLLYEDHDQNTRIYYLTGFYEGSVVPRIHAQGAVFMKILPVTAPDGSPAVQTSLMSYIHLDDGLMSDLIRLLRPLVGGAMSRRLSRGIEVTNQLGALIAQDRDRVARVAASLPGFPPSDLQTFVTKLQIVPQHAVISSRTTAAE